MFSQFFDFGLVDLPEREEKCDGEHMDDDVFDAKWVMVHGMMGRSSIKMKRSSDSKLLKTFVKPREEYPNYP